jgi:soluble lytic murein transglycosylase-like protein
MKLTEIVESEQLDEIKLKHFMAGAALGAAIGASSGMAVTHANDRSQISAARAKEAATEKSAKNKIDKKDAEIQNLTDIVLDKYKIDPKKAKEIVELTKKYEATSFPKAEDLLAVIGIESSFNPAAKSHLAHDKAIGLTQVRPKIWGIHASDLKGNLDKQISLSADILAKYYQKLGSKDKAIHAYNVGLTNVRHHTGLNPKYVEKWKQELKRYEG